MNIRGFYIIFKYSRYKYVANLCIFDATSLKILIWRKLFISFLLANLVLIIDTNITNRNKILFIGLIKHKSERIFIHKINNFRKPNIVFELLNFKIKISFLLADICIQCWEDDMHFLNIIWYYCFMKLQFELNIYGWISCHMKQTTKNEKNYININLCIHTPFYFEDLIPFYKSWD